MFDAHIRVRNDVYMCNISIRAHKLTSEQFTINDRMGKIIVFERGLRRNFRYLSVNDLRDAICRHLGVVLANKGIGGFDG